ncbi:MAG TPA: acyl carrier protein [Longimicrobiales bacterium]|nr:acyl carrier protein [Longimicrobiales bacterium]
MSVTDLSDSIHQTLRHVVPNAPAELAPDAPFRDQFEMDSLDFLNFVLALEKEHGVKIPEVRYPRCASLAGARAVLEDLLSRD